jgi:ArsR family transcriptional regulator
MTSQQADSLSSVFKALADPHRVRIVNLLANATEAVCVCDFVPELGLSQGTVSFHLKKLLDVGLLKREQRGTWAYYALDREGLDRLRDVFVTREE